MGIWGGVVPTSGRPLTVARTPSEPNLNIYCGVCDRTANPLHHHAEHLDLEWELGIHRLNHALPRVISYSDDLILLRGILKLARIGCLCITAHNRV